MLNAKMMFFLSQYRRQKQQLPLEPLDDLNILLRDGALPIYFGPQIFYLLFRLHSTGLHAFLAGVKNERKLCQLEPLAKNTNSNYHWMQLIKKII